MAVIFNASNTTGIGFTSDNSGNITFQSSAANTLSIASTGLCTIAYNGANPGLVPGMQYYVLNTAYTGNGTSTSAQTLLGLSSGVSLTPGVYYFDQHALMVKTAGTTSHTISMGWGGTATINWTAWQYNFNQSTAFNIQSAGSAMHAGTALTAVNVSGALTNASVYATTRIFGQLSVATSGTLLPQYTLSAAPGGAYTTQPGSYMLIYPIGTAGANVSIGTWA